MYFFVTLTPAHTSTVTVNYATSYGSAGTADFQAKSGVLTFTAGQTSKSVLISTTQDRWMEGAETFYFNLSNATGGVPISDGSAIGTINDDDDCGVSCQ